MLKLMLNHDLIRNKVPYLWAFGCILIYVLFWQVSKLTKVDFNCLNLVVNVDSWVAVLDFFGFAGDDTPVEESTSQPQQDGAYDYFSAVCIKCYHYIAFGLSFQPRKLPLWSRESRRWRPRSGHCRWWW